MRLERVSALLKIEISRILRVTINDPKIGFISIIEVKLSKDLGIAKVFYSQIGTEKEKEETLERLKKVRGVIKGELGRVLHLKTIPNLRFVFDPSLEKGADLVNKINQLNIHKAKNQDA